MDQQLFETLAKDWLTRRSDGELVAVEPARRVYQRTAYGWRDLRDRTQPVTDGQRVWPTIRLASESTGIAIPTLRQRCLQGIQGWRYCDQEDQSSEVADS